MLNPGTSLSEEGVVRGERWRVAESQVLGEETWILDQSCTATDRAHAQDFIDSIRRLT